MFYGIAGIVSLLLSLYFWWSHSGLYRLVADLQSSLWGVDIINISLLVSWAVSYAPLHFLVRRVERRYGVRRDPLTWRRLVRLVDFFYEERPGKVAGVGLIVFVVGAWLWGSSATSGPLTTLSVAKAEQGEPPRSRYVRLTDAEIHIDSALSYKRGRSVEHYYPVTSKQGGSDRVRVFVRLDGPDAASPPEEIIGELEFDGLPGPLRVHVEEKNLLAPNYFVVRHRRDPASSASAAAAAAGFGALLFATGILWWRVKGRSNGAARGYRTENRSRPDDEAVTALSDTSTPKTLYPSSSSAIRVLLGCSVFLGIGIWMGVSGEWPGFLCAGVSALGVIIATIRLLPGSTLLRLDRGGFTYTHLFRATSMPWSDIEAFFVVTVSPPGLKAKEMVGFNFAPTSDRARTARTVSNVVGECQGLLPETYGRSAEALAQILNAWLRAAAAPSDGRDERAPDARRRERARRDRAT